MATIVNLFGAPGAGKSTGSAYVFSMLKMKGVNCELITEFAKDKVWEKSTEVFKCQPYIFAKQLFRQSRVREKVDVIVTDSPLPLSIYYNSNPEIQDELAALVMKLFNMNTNLNIFINRDKPYNPVGRLHTENESLKIADEMKIKVLKNNNIPFVEVNGNTSGYNDIVNMILTHLKLQKRIQELKEERDSDIKKYEERFNQIRSEIEKWPQWKKECVFYKLEPLKDREDD